MNYDEAVRALLSLGSELAAPLQPALGGAAGARARKFDLRNMVTLAARLGDPHRAVPCAHIAGTNGKGSTAAMLDSILREAGLKTGLYTSPHLVRINERIRICGEEICDAEFAAAFTRIQAAIENLLASGSLAAHPTYFECLTGMAFDCFARQKLDFAIFEVGMGGRLDATNIVTPEVAVITQIDFDHENYLGHSIEEIAAEKAGIIKPGAWVVSAAGRPEARAVIARRAQELEARLIDVETAFSAEAAHGEAGCYRAKVRDTASAWQTEIALSLPGRFQVRNAVAAVAAARLLAERGFPAGDEAIRRGIAAAHWPGRLERMQRQPDVYIDGTHNPAGARELVAFWEDHFRNRRIILVYGAMRDKAVDEIAGLLFPRASRVILTEPRQPRAISAQALAEMAGHLAARVEVVPDPAAALARAIEAAAPPDAIFATGSLYLAGDLHRAWAARPAHATSAARHAG